MRVIRVQAGFSTPARSAGIGAAKTGLDEAITGPGCGALPE